jgi:SAM-dependent methyltransferase
MLAPLEQFAAALRCPSCGSGLAWKDAEPSCTADSSVCNVGKPFAIVSGIPVLVDPRNTVVVLDELAARGGKSDVRRRAAWSSVRVMRDRLMAPVARTRSNISRLLTLARGVAARPRILVIGGGTVGGGAEELYADTETDLLSFDVYVSPYVQVVADTHDIPICSHAFDAIVVQAVLEHVIEPARVVSEIHRVLKPGGLVYSEVPFLQQVHEGRYDFTRFTASGHRALFRQFEVIEFDLLDGPGTQLVWSLDYLARALFRSRWAGRVMRTIFFWLRLLDGLVGHSFAIDAASSTYFLGRRSERSIPLQELIAAYKGAQ